LISLGLELRNKYKKLLKDWRLEIGDWRLEIFDLRTHPCLPAGGPSASQEGSSSDY